MDSLDPIADGVPTRVERSLDVLRDLSRAADPQAMYDVYARGLADLFPTGRQITLSRRGLVAPRARVTRVSRWTSPGDSWSDDECPPVFEGGVLAELLHGGRLRLIDELDVAADDPAAALLDGQRSLLAVPLFDGGEALQMVVLTRAEPRAFPPERVPEVVWMSNLFARATQTAVLTVKLQAEQEQTRHDMRRIARLQRALLPTELPRVSTLDLAAYTRSTAEAGGDYYTVVPLPRGRVGLLLADVCGHGAPAAMLVAVVHSLVKTYAGPAHPPGHLMAYVNEHLVSLAARSAGTFVTAVYAVYDPDRATLTWSNAGHPPPRLSRGADGRRTALTGERCVPLGVVAGTEYPDAEVQLSPGDQVLLHTDGLTDAKNAADEPFGTERLDAALAPGPAGARAMIGGVLQALESFAGGTTAADDFTLLAMKFVKSRKKAGEISGEWRALGTADPRRSTRDEP